MCGSAWQLKKTAAPCQTQSSGDETNNWTENNYITLATNYYALKDITHHCLFYIPSQPLLIIHITPHHFITSTIVFLVVLVELCWLCWLWFLTVLF